DERFAPESSLEKKELRENVQRALAALPADYRQILTLRELGGLSYEELGETLGLEAGTVKSRLARARQKLCALLSRDGNFSAPASSKKEKGGVKRGM
ncbi:MAG: sigma-70 family RNA polymerase sigma factor, partial [Oscillospiraceae bacterium]|nr:sigma-70 family RNA polymerase sigma factor [Oscillospiraceae bacterium]